MDKRNSKIFISALAISFTLCCALCVSFQPRWQTNDDISMSMVAHGYGLAAYSSPNLIFSNILWGYLVRSIPSINGVFGYTIATLSALFVVAAVIVYVLRRVGFDWCIVIALIALLFVRPILFPQFTVNAGLMAVSAIACWCLFAENASKSCLVVGCLLAFLGFLVRSQEFLLVLIISIPILPWGKLTRIRTTGLAGACLIVAICGAAFLDHFSYLDADWHSFNALNPVRASFTDFGAGSLVKQDLETLTRHGYSENDIDLISNWFFVDSKIADPLNLKALLSESESTLFSKEALLNGGLAIKKLAHPVVFLLLLAAVVLFLMQPSQKLGWAWGLSLGAFLMLGFWGRPGVLRVYIPVISLLVLAPFLIQINDIARTRAVASNHLKAALFVFALVNSGLVISESRDLAESDKSVRLSFRDFPKDPVAAWGSEFPYESLYPVLGQDDVSLNFQIYGLGVFTLAPFSRAYLEAKNQRSVIDLLLSREGAMMVASNQYYKLLGKYCEQHYRGGVLVQSRYAMSSAPVYRLRCET